MGSAIRYSNGICHVAAQEQATNISWRIIHVGPTWNYSVSRQQLLCYLFFFFITFCLHVAIYLRFQLLASSMFSSNSVISILNNMGYMSALVVETYHASTWSSHTIFKFQQGALALVVRRHLVPSQLQQVCLERQRTRHRLQEACLVAERRCLGSNSSSNSNNNQLLHSVSFVAAKFYNKDCHYKMGWQIPGSL